MSAELICPLKFWIRTVRPLDEIADALQQAGVIEAYRQDSENVYEWFTTTPVGTDVALNVSRKHCDGELDFDEPLAFLVMRRELPAPSESMVIEIAAKVQAALQLPVCIGSIEDLGDDEYRYVASQTLGS